MPRRTRRGKSSSRRKPSWPSITISSRAAKPQTGNPEKWFKAALRKAPDDLPTRQVVAIWALEKGKLDFAKEQAEAALRIEAMPMPSEVRRQQRGPHAPRPGGLVAEGVVGSGALFREGHPREPQRLRRQEQHRLGPCRAGRPGQEAAGVGLCGRPIIATTRTIPTLLSTLGWVYFRRGEFDQARLALEQAIKATNGNLAMPIRPPTWPIFFTIRTRSGKPRKSWTTF